jgi:hypothetical protein
MRKRKKLKDRRGNMFLLTGEKLWSQERKNRMKGERRREWKKSERGEKGDGNGRRSREGRKETGMEVE